MSHTQRTLRSPLISAFSVIFFPSIIQIIGSGLVSQNCQHDRGTRENLEESLSFTRVATQHAALQTASKFLYQQLQSVRALGHMHAALTTKPQEHGEVNAAELSQR